LALHGAVQGWQARPHDPPQRYRASRPGANREATDRRVRSVLLKQSPLEQVPLLPDILRPSLTHLDHDALGLVNVAAEEMLGLVHFDELAHSGAASVQPLANSVERSVQGWRVTDENQRRQPGERFQAIGDFSLGVLARRIKRRRRRIAQPRDLL